MVSVAIGGLPLALHAVLSSLSVRLVRARLSALPLQHRQQLQAGNGSIVITSATKPARGRQHAFRSPTARPGGTSPRSAVVPGRFPSGAAAAPAP